MLAARHLALLVALRLALSLAAWSGGFRAVSDDDFARVVHAQEWTHAPALDPTGTSWLPFPFWLNGAVMLVFGTELDVARATAVALAVLSSALLYAAGRLLFERPRDALLGAAIATALPWSIRLGIATVPELPTAALTVFAVATIAARRHRLLGALALTAATLSRYEPWPVAAAFAALCLYDLASGKGSFARRAPARSPSTSPLALAAAAALALLGPAAWIAHNALAHGDPLHFLARVTAYKQALGRGADILAYPLALFREEPELAATAVLLALVALLERKPASVAAGRANRDPRTLPRVALCLGIMLATLTFAAARDGAPTHHAGRAVLPIWLAAALYLAPALRRALRYRKSAGPSREESPAARRQAVAAFILIIMPTGALMLRPWFARLDAFTPRHDEVAIGRAAAALAAPTDRILVISPDYRHFAIQAASARPWAFEVGQPNPKPRAPCCPEPPPADLTIAPSAWSQASPLATSRAWSIWRPEPPEAARPPEATPPPEGTPLPEATPSADANLKRSRTAAPAPR